MATWVSSPDCSQSFFVYLFCVTEKRTTAHEAPRVRGATLFGSGPLMSQRTASPRFHESTGEVAAAEPRADKTAAFDAIVTVGVLVARSDGWVHPAQFSQLHDFLDRHGFQSLLARVDLRHCFERRMRDLREPGGLETALAKLNRHERPGLSHLLIDAGEEIAAADGRLDPREDDMLRRIRIALRQRSSRSPRECHIPDERT